MTTETPSDPTITIWSERLEADLVEAGMEERQARAFGRAFELGLTRVLSQRPTQQELLAVIAELREEIADARSGLAEQGKQLANQGQQMATNQDLNDAIAGLRRDFSFRWLLFGGLVGAMLAGLYAVLGIILSKI